MTGPEYLERLFSLAGRVAVVTGGSSGIGAGMAAALARTARMLRDDALRASNENTFCVTSSAACASPPTCLTAAW